jgi:hypothetical protein
MMGIKSGESDLDALIPCNGLPLKSFWVILLNPAQSSQPTALKHIGGCSRMDLPTNQNFANGRPFYRASLPKLCAPSVSSV